MSSPKHVARDAKELRGKAPVLQTRLNTFADRKYRVGDVLKVTSVREEMMEQLASSQLVCGKEGACVHAHATNTLPGARDGRHKTGSEFIRLPFKHLRDAAALSQILIYVKGGAEQRVWLSPKEDWIAAGFDNVLSTWQRSGFRTIYEALKDFIRNKLPDTITYTVVHVEDYQTLPKDGTNMRVAKVRKHLRTLPGRGGVRILEESKRRSTGKPTWTKQSRGLGRIIHTEERRTPGRKHWP